MSDTILLTAVQISGIVNLAIWGAVAVFCVARLALPIYHPFFLYLVYHFLGFIVRPFTIVGNGSSFLWTRIGYSPGINDVVLTTLVDNVALLSAFFGFVLAARVKNGALPRMPRVILELKVSPVFLAALGLLSAEGIYATVISLKGAGLDSVLAYQTFLDDSAGQRLVGVSGYQTALAEFLPVICIFLYMTPKFRKLSYALIASYILVRLYAGGQRLSFVVLLIALLFYYLTYIKRRYPSATMVVAILLFSLCFEVIGNDRYAFRRLFTHETTVAQLWAGYVAERSGNFGTSDIVEYDVASAAISAITNNSDYSYGTQYLRILIWPIPRQMWENKPIYTSIVDLNKYGDFRYLTTTLYADSYMSFSFVSLIIVMLFFGWACSTMYHVASRTNSVIAYMFFWVFLIYLKTILRDGGVTFIYFWVFSMIPVVILSITGKARLWRDEPK